MTLNRTCIAIALITSIAFTPATLGIAHAKITAIDVQACPDGIAVSIVEDEMALAAPRVTFSVPGSVVREAVLIGQATGADVPGGAGNQYFFFTGAKLRGSVRGTVMVHGQRGERSQAFVVANRCPLLGSVRGTAFDDQNGNGTREAIEPVLHSFWWKLSGGGDWFVCGFSGGDGTFGPTVHPSSYTLTPIAPAGWRTTTPARNVMVRRYSEAALGNDIGFVRSPGAPGQTCGQYAPTAPNVPGAAAGNAAMPAQTFAPQTVSAGDAAMADVLTRGQFGSFNYLVAAAKATGLIDALYADGDYTLLAPSDTAFAKIPRYRLDPLLNNPGELARVLRNHIVPRRLLPALLAKTRSCPTLGEKPLVLATANGLTTVNGRVSLGNAIEGRNGLVYVIDVVLLTSP